MWEGAWAAAPRGIPACLGKHSCQGLAPHGHTAHIQGQVRAASVPTALQRVPGQGLGVTPEQIWGRTCSSPVSNHVGTKLKQSSVCSDATAALLL